MFYILNNQGHRIGARRHIEIAIDDARALSVLRGEVFTVNNRAGRMLAAVGPRKKVPKVQPDFGKVGMGDVEGPEAIRVAS